MNAIKHIFSALIMMIVIISATPAKAEDGFFDKVFSSKIDFPRDTITIETVEGRRYQFDVEVATSERQKAVGLMHRKSLAKNEGMLFVFGGEQKLSFWMKDTLIPLDMIFIRKDGTIAHIHSNARPLDKTQITSPVPAMAVLEINGGQSDSWGLKAGDKILHPAFRNVLAQ